ncbi:Glycine cleavage system T protein [Pseudomonas syringae pv. actinidiae]|uniref:Glycine cleavage system T protein n=1 Tax=Pseudomonas syringae pv. actinidiae TaxID=103796 RepID=A0AAN4Q8Z9_PSESF|nr:Glycine cleavage system T protein [Pseudomonas syringae pv. actinidiae]
MPGRMQAEFYPVVGNGFAVFEGLQIDVLPEARPQNTLSTGRRQVMLIASTGMIAVRMSNHRTLDRTPRVDIKITGWAVQTFGASNDKIHGATVWMGLLAMSGGRAGKFGDL